MKDLSATISDILVDGLEAQGLPNVDYARIRKQLEQAAEDRKEDIKHNLHELQEMAHLDEAIVFYHKDTIIGTIVATESFAEMLCEFLYQFSYVQIERWSRDEG